MNKLLFIGTLLAVSASAMNPNVDYYAQAVSSKEAALMQEELGNYTRADQFQKSFENQCLDGGFSHETIREIENFCEEQHNKKIQSENEKHADPEMYKKALQIIKVGETHKFSQYEANKIKSYVQNHLKEFDDRSKDAFRYLGFI